MKIIINLRKISDEKYNKEFKFTEFPVRIGRETENEIILEDAKKIVSRSHAIIQNNSGSFQLIDLGSANFTYLNGEKLFPNVDNNLKNGDLIKIGNYELNIIIEQFKTTPAFDEQKTMVFSSPFDDEVTRIFEGINKLSEKYYTDNSPLKSEMLRVSLMQNIEKLIPDESIHVLSEYFANKFLDQALINQSKNYLSSVNIPRAEKQKIVSESQFILNDNLKKITPDYSFSSHFSEAIDILMDTMIKLIKGFLQFKQEFFGVTIYQTIPTGSLKEIKEYLFNQEISTDEQKKRVNLIKEEAQKLLAHQIGLLKGYKNSVTEGSQSMLQSLDPEIIEKETASKQTSSLENILPYLKKIKTLEAIKKSYKKYISDPYYLEKKFFRPAFIKGYQKPISLKDEIGEY